MTIGVIITGLDTPTEASPISQYTRAAHRSNIIWRHRCWSAARSRTVSRGWVCCQGLGYAACSNTSRRAA